MKYVVIATNNTHKVSEMASALDWPTWKFLTLSDIGSYPEPVEDAPDFMGNARIKARAAFEHTGHAALADDSGLVVDALDGAPGVFSARYAGMHGNDEANNQKLLNNLADVELPDKRTARFVCALCFIDEDGTEYNAQGTIEGRIAFAPRGNAGFGYDPLFEAEAFNFEKTTAELTQDEKNKISHRGNALRALKEVLEAHI
ncbi:MAG: RdgB/HAM1 family non-canonical purine NTP pyrophosphatase [Eggerthellaceae bacterium]|nr:RdgB/HAM1 family non-canonical purine NTP pyrophosphatase [Eggerthellaceae bacterium]